MSRLRLLLADLRPLALDCRAPGSLRARRIFLREEKFRRRRRQSHGRDEALQRASKRRKLWFVERAKPREQLCCGRFRSVLENRAAASRDSNDAAAAIRGVLRRRHESAFDEPIHDGRDRAPVRERALRQVVQRARRVCRETAQHVQLCGRHAGPSRATRGEAQASDETTDRVGCSLGVLRPLAFHGGSSHECYLYTGRRGALTMRGKPRNLWGPTRLSSPQR